ncbi:MAG: ABC transporter permease, partial [Lachnospiraceae bacterium]|nr:ABC transporter permease [Lachnospiraceae bacterium]
MVLPINILGYFTAMEAGSVLFYLGFDLAAALIWIFIFRIHFVFVSSPLILLEALIMVVLGLFFMVQLNYYLGLLTLKYEEIGTFLMIKNNLTALVTGSIVPLVLFPETVLRVMKLLPFYYITYLPSMLLTGQCREEAGIGILVLALWCAALGLLIRTTWRKYRLKYDGAGI